MVGLNRTCVWVVLFVQLRISEWVSDGIPKGKPHFWLWTGQSRANGSGLHEVWICINIYICLLDLLVECANINVLKKVVNPFIHHDHHETFPDSAESSWSRLKHGCPDARGSWSCRSQRNFEWPSLRGQILKDTQDTPLFQPLPIGRTHVFDWTIGDELLLLWWLFQVYFTPRKPDQRHDNSVFSAEKGSK
jgi:hypothetical protein